MSRKESDLVIVRSTIRMAHELGLKVVAEGVETDWQLVQLRQLGCNQIQGFVYSKPIPGLAIPDWTTSFNEEHGNPVSTEAANADESNILPIISDAG